MALVFRANMLIPPLFVKSRRPCP